MLVRNNIVSIVLERRDQPCMAYEQARVTIFILYKIVCIYMDYGNVRRSRAIQLFSLSDFIWEYKK